MGERLDVQIRWQVRRDLPQVLEIERESFETPWTDDDFESCTRQRNVIGNVAENNHRIVGFMVYQLHKARLEILNFAVASEFRRREVGKQMIQRLVDKLSQQRRTEIRVAIRESNLPAQQFLRAMSFRAAAVDRKHYEDTGEAAYHFVYRAKNRADECGEGDGK